MQQQSPIALTSLAPAGYLDSKHGQPLHRHPGIGHLAVALLLAGSAFSPVTATPPLSVLQGMYKP